MSNNTTIQWTDVTDNIFRVKGGGWWCRKISPGCANCYAAKLNQNSFYGGNKLKYTGNAPAMEIQMGVINGWAKMRKPKKHFVASMTDIFGDWVTKAQAIEFLRGMWRAPNQTFQMLTKRPDIARKYIEHWLQFDMLSELPSNMWIGTSVEDQQRADERIPELLQIPAKVRFLSVEPMLGPVDLKFMSRSFGFPQHITADGRAVGMPQGISWVIFGGESGPNSRPCNVEWIHDGVKQCKAAGVKAFVKQLGSKPFSEKHGHVKDLAFSDGKIPSGITKFEGTYHTKETFSFDDPKGGDMSEWPEDLRVREMPTA